MSLKPRYPRPKGSRLALATRTAESRNRLSVIRYLLDNYPSDDVNSRAYKRHEDIIHAVRCWCVSDFTRINEVNQSALYMLAPDHPGERWGGLPIESVDTIELTKCGKPWGVILQQFAHVGSAVWDDIDAYSGPFELHFPPTPLASFLSPGKALIAVATHPGREVRWAWDNQTLPEPLKHSQMYESIMATKVN